MKLAASWLFSACGFLALGLTLAKECSVQIQHECGQPGCDCTNQPGDKYCISVSKVECVSGECTSIGCSCNPCYTGVNCDKYVNKHAPTYGASLQTIEAWAEGEQSFTFASASDSDANECFQTAGFVTACKCAEILYTIIETDDEAAVSIPDPTQSSIRFIPNTKATYKFVISATNADSTKIPATITLLLRVVDKLQPVVQSELSPSFPKTLNEASHSDGPSNVQKREVEIQGQYLGGRQTNTHEEALLSRQRRGVNGAGIPDSMTFTLTRTVPSASNVFVIGQLLSYQLTIAVPLTTIDCLVEIYSQKAWSTIFSISNVRISTGQNIVLSPNTTQAMYESSANDGRYDRSYIDLGMVTNAGSDSANAASSQIVMSFDVLPLHHPAINDSATYTVSVGAQYQNQSQVWVAVDTLQAGGVINQTSTPILYTSSVAPTFTLTGPSNLTVASTGVWTLQMTLYDLYNNITVTAFALNTSISLSICRISVEAFGSAYSSYAGMDQGANYSQTTFDSTGAVTGAILNLGEIVNSGFNSGSLAASSYQITVQVVATLMNTTLVALNSTYYLGVSATISDSLIYSTAASFTALAMQLTSTTSATAFTLTTVTPQVAVGAMASFLVNMTLPTGSTLDYSVEVATPINGTTFMNVTRIRVMSVGYNYPCLAVPNITFSSNDAVNYDYAAINLGIVSNTAQRSKPWANTISVEISAQLLSTAAVAVGQNLTVVAGVRLGSDSYWVAQTNFIVVAQPASSTVPPTITLTNLMPDTFIYAWSSVAYFIDVYVPPTTTVYPLTVNVTSSVVGGTAVTKLCKVEVYQVGDGIVFSNGNIAPSVVYYNTTREMTLDGLPVNTMATLTFPSLTNVLAQDWPWLAVQLSTIRLRIVVQSRPNSTGAVSGAPLTTNFAIGYSLTPSQTWLAQDNITYNGTKLTPFANMVVGQPMPTLTTSNWQQNSPVPALYLGAAVAIDLTLSTPFLSISDFSAQATVSGASLSICQLRVRAVGTNMGCLNEGYSTTYSSVSNQTSAATLPLLAVTNIEPYSAFSENTSDNSLYYQLVIMLRDIPTTTSANYTYGYTFTTNSGMSWTGSGLINGIATVDTATPGEPVVTLAKANPFPSITIGGAALFTVQMYIPPSTSAQYRLEVYGPWTTTDAGKFGLWDVRVVSAGYNVPCLDGAFLAKYGTQYNATFDTSATPVNDTVVLNLGHVANVANTSIVAQVDATNLVTVEILAYIPPTSTAQVNDTLSLSAALYYSSSNVWAGFSNFTVLGNPISNEALVEPYFVLQSQTPNSTQQQIGVPATWYLNITYPQIMSSMVLNFNMSSARGEAIMTVQYIRVFFGANIVHSTPIITYGNISSSSSQVYKATVDLGQVLNAWTSHRDQFRPGTHADDIITIAFDVTVADNLANTNGANVSFSVQANYVTNGTANQRIMTAFAAVLSNAADNTVFTWNAWTDNVTSQILQSSIINLYLFVNQSTASRRFPRNLVAHYRIPYFSQFINVTNCTGKYPDSINYSTKGVDFQWNVLYFGEYSSLTFTMKLDPNVTLPVGLFSQSVTIPVDLTYSRTNKSDQTGNTVDYWFTPIIPVQFTAYIPECYTALGMQSKNITDCQISASSSYGTNVATQARLNVGLGWVSAPRGPPFLKSEFVQVDMGVQTKFTAIAVQPQPGYNQSHVMSFYLQYSKLGLRWYDAIDDSGNRRYFEAYFPSNSNDSTTITIQFGTQPFVGQFIRVIPQNNSANSYYQRLRFEIYGCLATGSVAQTYVCPTTSSVITTVPRQMLINPNDGRLFACMLEGVGGNVVCSYTSDFGTSWFSIDDNVYNINYYNNNTGCLYGVARSLDTYLRSDDYGDTWFAVEASEYGNMTVGTGVTAALNLPFNAWDSMTQVALTAMYNYTWSGHTWSVSVSGITYDGSTVAWWGQSVWTP